MKKMRIAIACSSLCASRGGSERAATNLAAEMSGRGHEIILLSAKDKGQSDIPLYGIPENAQHIYWPFEGRHAEIRALRQKLVDWGADVFLSMQSGAEHLYWSMVCMGSGIPFICSERVDPIVFTENIGWNKSGRYAVLAGADCIHELTPTYIDSVPDFFRNKVQVIPNTLPIKSIVADPVGKDRKKLMFLARLCDQKQPELLLDAFNKIKKDYPDWDLIIWGHGPYEKELCRKIDKNKQIEFRGICKNTPEAYAEVQIYCLPSWFEGFPNTVLEAMNAGLPVVGMADCKGVAGVVKDNVTGLLAKENNSDALALALATLMKNPELRKKMGAAGKAACMEYAPDKIYDQWENLFQKMTSIKGRTAMDAMREEPFASRATLSASARREWLFRDFGEPMPYTFGWFRERSANIVRHGWKILRKKLSFSKKELS